jgi:hypothetical protein
MQFASMRLIAGIASIVISSACGSAEPIAPAQQSPRLSWAEAKEEIDQAFKDARERIINVTRKEPRVANFGAGSGGLQRPGTSVMDMVVSRTPLHGTVPKVIVLDIYIEREYDVKSGQTSPFRIVRHVVKDEGHEMIAELEKYFKQKNWAYEIVDRKKPAMRPGEMPKVSPAF